MESLIQDFRYAFRSLLKSSGFSTVVVLALAVGIAATTVIFSVVDHVVLRPLDYPDAAQLVAIREGIKEMSGVDLGVNASHYLEWRRDCRSCQALAAGRSAEFTLTGVGDAEKLSAARISTSMLQMLGARAQVGGIFTADLDRDQGEHTVILSDALWRSRFGADPAIVGRSITLDGMPWVVTGMLSADYHPPSSQESGWTLPASPDVYLPLALTAREATTVGEYNYSVVARLAPGRGIEDLQAELDAIETRLSEADQYRMNFRARVTPLREQIVGSSARALGLLFGAVGVVLGIVCLNLGSLVLARNVARRRESAVRVALGAGQARLIRQTFAETVLLSLTGGGIGILLANWGLGTVLRLAPALPRAREITLDARVIAGAFLLSLMTGVMFGAVPALRAGRSDPGDALRGTGRAITGDRRARRNRGLLIGSQVALTALLLISAGLLAASFARVLRVDKGFAGGPLFALDISLPANVYATREQRRAFYEEALPRLAGLPGVRRSAISTRLPLEGEIQV
ncbi:MAG: ABC transporter permease, partial [Gemmatimonadetes bacterium]|nr:ABC transporter permease [Gemmatimonadota bacterium]